jgi:sugar phosphate isomerase/epimerase
VHCKENGALLGEGVVDFPKFKESLDAAGYRDWLIMEGAIPKGGPLIESYQANRKTLERIFRA